MFVDLLSVKATERSLFLSKREEADGRFIRPMVEERTNYMTYVLKKRDFRFFFMFIFHMIASAKREKIKMYVNCRNVSRDCRDLEAWLEKIIAQRSQLDLSRAICKHTDILSMLTPWNAQTIRFHHSKIYSILSCFVFLVDYEVIVKHY